MEIIQIFKLFIKCFTEAKGHTTTITINGNTTNNDDAEIFFYLVDTAITSDVAKRQLFPLHTVAECSTSLANDAKRYFFYSVDIAWTSDVAKRYFFIQ